MKKFELSIGILATWIGLALACLLFGKAIQRMIAYDKMMSTQQQREAQWHEEWKKEKGCVHTGYFRSGRYGSNQRTFLCNGTVLIEEGTKMYDKERGVYVKNW